MTTKYWALVVCRPTLETSNQLPLEPPWSACNAAVFRLEGATDCRAPKPRAFLVSCPMTRRFPRAAYFLDFHGTSRARHVSCLCLVFFYNPSLFAICTKYNKQMGGNRNKRGGRELSSAHPYGGGAKPGMVTGISYKLNLRTRITTTTITMRSG
jgi:hypothetical protein